jgi:DNA-binding IclR family transcriptional regulator
VRYPAKNDQHYSSLRNALRILNLFSVDEPELQLHDVMMKLQIGKSTAFRLVHTLMIEGFIVRDPYAKSYRLAASMLAMGQTIITKVDLCNKSKGILEILTDQSGETAHIAIFKDFQALYLLKVDSRYPANLLSHAGKKNPVHCTSTGQVLLAHQADSAIEQVIERGLTPFTSKTITDPAKLKSLLKKIRTTGFAVSKEELHDGVSSIAAPVRNQKGDCIASVSIAGPTSRINQITMPKLIMKVQHAADEVTRKLQERDFFNLT